MATWRLAGAATLLVGDAIEPLAALAAHAVPDARVAVEALRDLPLVRVVAAELVPPGTAIRAVLTGERAVTAEVELALLGSGDVRRVVWTVESTGRGAVLWRAVDAYTGEILSGLRDDGLAGPAAILLVRGRERRPCDLVAWSRCVLGLPFSIELDQPRLDGSTCRVWGVVAQGATPGAAAPGPRAAAARAAS